MTEYVINTDLTKAVQKMINDKELPELSCLRDNKVTIFSLMVVKTDAKGEPVPCKGRPIICRKISAPLQVITEGHYLLVADQGFWDESNEHHKSANLFHALMHIDIEKDDKGHLKMRSRKPDVQLFHSEAAIFGPHSAALLDVREALVKSADRFAESVKA